MPGTLFVVATPIGNLEDITLRALRVLREVALIAAEDTRRTSRLLARHAITTRVTSLHEHNERQKSPALIGRLTAGDSIALVSDAGTPTVSDPGGHLVQMAAEAGIRVEPVPGPSAIVSALSVSGIASDGFAFLGFPPTRSKDRERWFQRVLAIGGMIVFFEAPHRIRATLQQLLQIAGDVPIVVARELTKVHEQLLRGTTSTVIEELHDGIGEYTVIASIGRTTDDMVPIVRSPNEMAAEFDEMTKTKAASRRQAVAVLARKYRVPVNAVYKTLELARKSGD
jgi:16S rRNA (cytidine1402-2'-O)-methyltransferase